MLGLEAHQSPTLGWASAYNVMFNGPAGFKILVTTLTVWDQIPQKNDGYARRFLEEKKYMNEFISLYSTIWTRQAKSNHSSRNQSNTELINKRVMSNMLCGSVYWLAIQEMLAPV